MAAKVKLTPQEIRHKRSRDQLTYITNRVKMDWAYGSIKNFRHLLISAGLSEKEINEKYFSSELDKKVGFNDVKDFLSDLRIGIETAIWLELNPPVIEKDPEIESVRAINLGVVSGKTPFDESNKEEESESFELPKSPLETAFLFWFQKKAAKQILYDLMEHHIRAHVLIADTGYGKTFIAGAILRRLLDMDWAKGKTFSPWPYVYVTKATDLEQTKRVFKNFFNIDPIQDVLTINIDQLRAEFGKRFVRQEIDVSQGEESVKWKWRKNVYPIVVMWNECQALKNTHSMQSQIGQSYNEIDDDNIYQCFISATPGTKVSEFKCISVATRVPYDFGLSKGVSLCNDHWNDFATNVASDWGRLNIAPNENSEGAIERLMNYLERYIVRVKGVHPQFKALNQIQMIDFSTAEGREFYDSAIDRFLKKKAKIESNDDMSAGQRNINMLVALLQFRIAAESNPDRVRYVAKAMWESVNKGNQAAVAAFNFKVSITKVVDTLVNDYGVDRNLISLIWGGAPKETEKQKKKRKIESSDEFKKAMEEADITLDDLDLDDVMDFVEVDEALQEKLKPQNAKQRQKEIDRFQEGKSLYCLYTFRAGGVGLSLHHTDEFTKEKVRHKKSGYAIEEDIPKIPTRQRITFVAPTYSAIEMVQGLGRCPRLTSLSNTPQLLIFFRGTVEERVARIVGLKLRCLSKVVKQKAAWENVIIGRDPDLEEKKEMDNATRMLSDMIKKGEEESGLVSEAPPDDDDDENGFKESDPDKWKK